MNAIGFRCKDVDGGVESGKNFRHVSDSIFFSDDLYTVARCLKHAWDNNFSVI